MERVVRRTSALSGLRHRRPGLGQATRGCGLAGTTSGPSPAAVDGGGVVPARAAGAAPRLRPPVHVLPRARVPAVRRRAQGGQRLSALRDPRLPQAALLQAAPGGRGRAARHGVRRRHGHIPGGDVDVHHRHPRPPRLSLGLALPRRLR